MLYVVVILKQITASLRGNESVVASGLLTENKAEISDLFVEMIKTIIQLPCDGTRE